MSVLTTALFPLTAHVLPKGKLPLRIFEPRYIRMVTAAASQKREFCMCMLDSMAAPETFLNMYPLITRVHIADFNLLPGGILGITVEGMELRRLNRVWQEPDGLKVGESEVVVPWQPRALQDEHTILAQQLKRLYQETDSLRQLELTFNEQDASWLCLRWLELLPMKTDDKQLLIEQPDCTAALAFLGKAIKRVENYRT